MWMMFELALRIKISTILDQNPRANVSKFHKIIHYGQRGVLIFMIVTFTGAVAFAVYLAVDEKDLNDCLFYNVVGWLFFTTFVLMAGVNGFLIFQMKKKNRLLNQENIFGNEKRRI